LRTKDAEDKLQIRNELKIITIPKPIFALWSDVIFNNAHKELIAPGTLMKFNERIIWKTKSKNLAHE